MPDPTIKTISIIGCGWLGFPLATHLLESGYPHIKGSTTSSEKLPVLRQAGIDAHIASLTPEPQGQNWPDLLAADTLIVDIPPRQSKQGEDFHPQQMRNLASLIENSPLSEIIYVSSTSVYPELNKTMSEDDVLDPQQSASPHLVEAEQIITGLRKAGKTVTILRCGGLMGYDRIPGKYVRGRRDITTGDVPVNYIHRDDVVAIISALLTQEIGNETFNVVAPEHPPRRAVYEKSCLENHWEVPTFTQPESPESFKVVSSEKITRRLSYTFAYPNPLDFHYYKG
ncbi:NAD-dependent epimerase/dehydratase family protein [Persicitalea jodogahamensis]|uniref:NAD(P)-dependent oxidoreductase n=1 Tax=Persicitalea jodogahamensis TaxID=402147 RepID=A0A8J3D3J4_9BACT|nr:NAD-dependent epimerase/dehydratase family protein [Persicitalea jodogahamensis]GHB68744.1 NAD(P)-dependent oxidoreductase [Persicitalea jodogahamensis]